MTEQERQELIEERDKTRLELDNARFADPKKVRRIDAINSLLMTDGQSEKAVFDKVIKGRKTSIGLNAKKPYSRKGKVG